MVKKRRQQKLNWRSQSSKIPLGGGIAKSITSSSADNEANLRVNEQGKEKRLFTTNYTTSRTKTSQNPHHTTSRREFDPMPHKSQVYRLAADTSIYTEVEHPRRQRLTRRPLRVLDAVAETPVGAGRAQRGGGGGVSGARGPEAGAAGAVGRDEARVARGRRVRRAGRRRAAGGADSVSERRCVASRCGASCVAGGFSVTNGVCR